MSESVLLSSPHLTSAESLVLQAFRIMAPPPKLTVSQWADEKRILSARNAAEVGQWRTDRAPYLREIMDAFSDPLVNEVTFAKSAQVGGTECLNNVIGYFIDQDPSPILYVAETTEKAEAWSKERFMNMVRDTPCLSGKIESGKGPSSQNTIGFKEYAGGDIAIVGAGSDGSLASRPRRVVLKDELDKWVETRAGDPDARADMRASTFGGRKKIGNISTPLEHDPPDKTSRIMAKYEASDKRRYYVPCPSCKHEQVLREGQLKFERPGDTGDKVSRVWYECEKCGWNITHMHKRRMLAAGRWISEKPFAGHAGFHISALYSPWVTWDEYAEAFLRMKRQQDTYRVFVNEWRGEPWNPDMATQKDISAYTARCEEYGDIVPGGACLIVASADIQDDRIESQIMAFDENRQCWGLDFRIFYGKPHLLTDSKSLPEVWQQLDALWQQTWQHEYGLTMSIDFALIDQGFLMDEVQKFCKPRRSRNIYPCRGMSNTAHELVGRANKNNRMKVKYFPIGTNRAKEIIFSNVEITEPGPGYMHWNKKFDAEYFKQLLTSERHKWVKGIKVYEKISNAARNEALDLNVYSLAAFELARPLLPIRKAQVEEARKQWERERGVEQKEPEEKPAQKQPVPTHRHQGFFSNRRRG